MIPKFKVYDNHRKEYVEDEVMAIGTAGNLYMLHLDNDGKQTWEKCYLKDEFNVIMED